MHGFSYNVIERVILYMCIDVDECSREQHNCSLFQNWMCINKEPPEMFSCECKDGYIIGDNNYCEGKAIIIDYHDLPD